MADEEEGSGCTPARTMAACPRLPRPWEEEATSGAMEGPGRHADDVARVAAGLEGDVAWPDDGRAVASGDG
jgi:hypothetical protein